MLKISVIIPVYNVEKYIVRCLESVTSQNRGNFDIECLVIDDCSPDKSLVMAQKFVESFEGGVKFVILQQERNMGQSAARNLGIRKATGDYLYFLDSDDYLHPNCFEAMVSSLEQLPEADFVEGGYHSSKDGRNYPEKGAYLELTSKKEMLEKFYMGKVSHLACNKMIRRKIVVDNSLFFVEGIIFEDIQWTHRLYHYISAMVVIPDVTYEYVYNPSSTSNTPQAKVTKSINSFAYVLGSFLDAQEEKAVYVDHKLFVFHYMLNAVDIGLKGDAGKEATERLDDVKKRLFADTLKHGRIILALFFLLMFTPFCYLLKTTFVRRRINMMEKGVGLVAKKTNWLHGH